MKKPRTMVGGATTVAKPEYSSSSRCWGDLPKDMIDSILGRLTLLADYDRFGAVCSTWRRASLDPINRNRRIESSLCSSSPLLLLPPHHNDNGKSPEENPWKFTLFDVVRGNTIVKELTSPPIPYSRERFYGSTRGWLIFEDGNYSLTLINPFYTGGGGGGVIRLPRLPDQKDTDKVALSADPALSPNDYMVFVIYRHDNNVLFIKSRDNDWTWINFYPDHPFHFYGPYSYIYDLVFHKGLVYAVGEHNVLYVCDIFKEGVDLLRVDPPTPDGFDGWCYIVQSPDDDELILVYMSDTGDLPEFQFHVYKLLLAPGGPATWHEMKNLGSDRKSIFIGSNHSVCIKSCHGGFQPNSIYFLDHGNVRTLQFNKLGFTTWKTGALGDVTNAEIWLRALTSRQRIGSSLLYLEAGNRYHNKVATDDF